MVIPQTALALEGFLIVFYWNWLRIRGFSVAPTCLDLAKLA